MWRYVLDQVAAHDQGGGNSEPNLGVVQFICCLGYKALGLRYMALNHDMLVLW